MKTEIIERAEQVTPARAEIRRGIRNNEETLFIPIFSDIYKHPSQNRLSILYVVNLVEEYGWFFCFEQIQIVEPPEISLDAFDTK